MLDALILLGCFVVLLGLSAAICCLRRHRVAGACLTVATLAVGIFFTVVISGGIIGDLWDAMLALCLFALVAPPFALSGGAADLAAALRALHGKRPLSRAALEKASRALSFLFVLLFLGAALIVFISLLSMFNHLEDWSTFFVNLAVALVPLGYALILCMVLLPFKALIERRRIDSEEQAAAL